MSALSSTERALLLSLLTRAGYVACRECDSYGVHDASGVCAGCREANALQAQLAESSRCERCDRDEAERELVDMRREYERSIAGSCR